MKLIKSRIVSNKRLNQDSWQMIFEATPIALAAKPGQFINVKLDKVKFPLFRRPLSIFRCVKLAEKVLGLEVIYKVVGLGTKIMTDLRPGDELDIIGPLGHGFECKPDNKNIVLLAGGIGAAALFMLGEEISPKAKDSDLNLHILLGATTKEELLLEAEFKTLAGKVAIATDNGAYGYHGLVTDMLQDRLCSGEISPDCTIYACGPEPMLKALAPLCKQYGITAQVSIERHMMCGIGACLSCVCKVDKKIVPLRREAQSSSHVQFTAEEEYGYALVCQEGPVFYLDEVILDE